MRDKYRLSDRFSLIASRLAPDEADADVEQFAATKKQRDELAHGVLENEGALRVAPMHELLKRYLSLHASSRRP